jgi:RNA polymerase sigma-70 factor (ECF subfamily)
VTAADPFEAHRGRLLGLAYRMLGSRADAEDAVQDAWLRWAASDRAAIANPEAYLVTIVTRLCLDRLKSARHTREVYVGPWLPEPVPDAEALSPHAATELADDLSFALLLALERLSPLERAAFLLHDVFDEPFSEVAETLGRSEAAVRQLASRARKAVREERAARQASPESHARLLAAFAAALASRDPTQLKAVLRDDAVVITDGGGRKPAALNPIRSADRVARFFFGLLRKFESRGLQVSVSPATLNGAPGLLVYLNGALDQALTLSVDGDRIAAIYSVRNPDKLGALPH